MGVLNVTPDSFSDGGRYLDAEVAAARALGVPMTEVGAVTSQPGIRVFASGREVAVAQPDLCRALAFQGGMAQRLRSTVQPIRDHLRLHEVETLNRQCSTVLHRVGNRGE